MGEMLEYYAKFTINLFDLAEVRSDCSSIRACLNSLHELGCPGLDDDAIVNVDFDAITNELTLYGDEDVLKDISDWFDVII